jgi:hypothetical protein
VWRFPSSSEGVGRAPHGKMPAQDFDEQKHNFWIAKVYADFHLDDGHFPFLCVAYHQFVYRL